MVDVADRVRRLRERSGLTQAQVAERAGLERVEVNQIERGKNSCGSWRVRAGLATAFSVRVSTMAEYLDGKIDLAEVSARIGAKETSGELRAVRLLRDRSEWPAALAASQAAAAVMDPGLDVADWDRVSQLYDGPSVPTTLTPRGVDRLARLPRLSRGFRALAASRKVFPQ